MSHGGSWEFTDNQWQKTALHMAAWKGHSELVEKLLEISNPQVKMITANNSRDNSMVEQPKPILPLSFMDNHRKDSSSYPY